MSRKERWLYLSLIVVAGLVGGAASNVFIRAGAAFGATPHHHHSHRHLLRNLAAHTVTAREIVLVDDAGRKRAELHMISGEPELALLGPNGRMRVSLAVGPHGVARARFYNEKGDAQAALGVTGDGRPALALMDRNRDLRATVDVSRHGAPSVRLFGPKGPLAGLNVTPNGLPGLVLLNSDGKTLGAFDITSEGRSALTLYDPAGNVLAGLP